MGAPDRGGGRENKKGSLRKSKVNAAEAAKKAARAPKEERPLHAPAAPRLELLQPAPATMYADVCVHLTSRQFDRDREAVLRRARSAGVVALIVSSADAEKQKDVVDLCRSFPGTLYATVGALPDNVKRTNDKAMTAWVDAAVDAALSQPCVAAFHSGLDLGREPATHHAQERLLEMHYAAARRVHVPLVLHVAPGSLARVLEIVTTCRENSDGEDAYPMRLALYNAAAHVHAGPAEEESEQDGDALAAWCDAGNWVCFTAAALSEPEAQGAALIRAAVGRILASHTQRCLLASGAPSFTPQTLADSYLRTLRNEPSNLPAVAADAIAACKSAGGNDGAVDLAAALFSNALQFFGIQHGNDEPAPDSSENAAVQAHPPQKAGGTSASVRVTSAAQGAAASDSDSDAEIEEGDRRTAPPAMRSAFAHLAVEDDEEGDEDDVEEGTDSAAIDAYFCGRCRTALFASRDVVHHTAGAAAARDARLVAATAPEAADDNLCLPHVFVCVPSDADLSPAELVETALHLAVDTADAEDAGAGHAVTQRLSCLKCSCKLGRFSLAPQACGCGVLVPGPCVKLQAARLDFAAQHMAAAVGAFDGDDSDDSTAGKAAPSRRKAPKPKRENKMNLSSFRNKN